MQCSFSALASSVTCMTWCQLLPLGRRALTPSPGLCVLAKAACPQMQAPRYWWPLTHLLMLHTHIINVEVFRYSQLSWTFFFEKEKKKLIIFWTSLSKLETLSIFQLSSKNTYLVEENFLCCYFFFKNFLPYKKQNLSTTFKAFSVCSPSHTFYEKSAIF